MDDAELLYQAYLGIAVLRTVLRYAGRKGSPLQGGVTRCDELLADIGKAHPEFAPRSALRGKPNG